MDTSARTEVRIPASGCDERIHRPSGGAFTGSDAGTYWRCGCGKFAIPTTYGAELVPFANIDPDNLAIEHANAVCDCGARTRAYQYGTVTEHADTCAAHPEGDVGANV